MDIILWIMLALALAGIVAALITMWRGWKEDRRPMSWAELPVIPPTR